MASKEIGLFFGSFNPIHNGHLMIANYMAEFMTLDQVWFVISPQNPFKADQQLLQDYHRRELAQRAVGDYLKFRVSAVEFQLPKPSYTIDTLSFLTEKYPDYQFSIIMGSDQLPNFHRWKNPEQILDRYKILVYPRMVNREAGDGVCNTEDIKVNHPSVTMVKAPKIEISSTFLRNAIKNGKDVRFFMPEATWQYLEEMHFYR
jgi:nicotinate-nucleotide adenylyltransferase